MGYKGYKDGLQPESLADGKDMWGWKMLLNRAGQTAGLLFLGVCLNAELCVHCDLCVEAAQVLCWLLPSLQKHKNNNGYNGR
jgi:hypothetical protein